MTDEEFANYLAKMKADHAIKMAALEEEAASFREPAKKLDVEITKEYFFIMTMTYVREYGYFGRLFRSYHLKKHLKGKINRSLCELCNW